jgi:transposase
MNKLEKEANRAQWLQHVSAWGKSGLTQSAYCRQQGLNGALLSAWVVRVKKAPVELGQCSPTLVPLKVEPAATTGALGEARLV